MSPGRLRLLRHLHEHGPATPGELRQADHPIAQVSLAKRAGHITGDDNNRYRLTALGRYMLHAHELAEQQRQATQ